MNPEPNWGPTGKAVYERTYQRTKPNGEPETWLDTVTRVVNGNLSLVDPRHIKPGEREQLIELFYNFRALPAGRHLWASGVPGRQFLFNCHVAGWGEKFSDHFRFTFLRLMEGGGVGTNYAAKYLAPYRAPLRSLKVHIVCDPGHADYETLQAAGVLSDAYTSDWPGAYEIQDSREGWADALTDLLDTYYRPDVKHAARVYDVTYVRPAGARLKAFGGAASGPLPLANMLRSIAAVMNHSSGGYISPLEAMEIDHAIASCVVAGGNRRSARMAIMPWNDPFILDFIQCKEGTSAHWTTNISVGIDDDFIRSVRSGDACAKNLLWSIANRMLKNGEPGIWNSSLSNQGEPNPVVATNPCGEIALEPWENCNLGHINMSAFVDSEGEYDAYECWQAHKLMTRFLIRATYGDVRDDKQAEVLARNRRIGVGHFGVQGWLAKKGIKYSEAPDHDGVQLELRWCASAVANEAREYAHELRIPAPVKCTTVAPTGTIAKLAGATEGIHPIYSRYFIRRVRYSMLDSAQAMTVRAAIMQSLKVETDMYDSTGNTMVVEYPTKESLVEEIESMEIDPSVVESADEIPLESMLAFQEMYQRCYADNAVSFTVNVPEGKYSASELVDELAEWLPKLKGTTVMPDGSRPQAPYERITEREYYASGTGVVEDSVNAECSTNSCPIR